MVYQFKSLNVLAVAVLALSAALSGCSDKAKEPTLLPVGTSVQATTITVEKATLPIVATSPGNVIAQQQAMISSRLMGFLREINVPVSYTHLRAHETRHDLVCRLLLEK